MSFPHCISLDGIEYGSYGHKPSSIKSEIQRIAELDLGEAWLEQQVEKFRDYLTKKITPVRQAVELYKKAHQIITRQSS